MATGVRRSRGSASGRKATGASGRKVAAGKPARRQSAPRGSSARRKTISRKGAAAKTASARKRPPKGSAARRSAPKRTASRKTPARKVAAAKRIGARKRPPKGLTKRPIPQTSASAARIKTSEERIAALQRDLEQLRQQRDEALQRLEETSERLRAMETERTATLDTGILDEPTPAITDLEAGSDSSLGEENVCPEESSSEESPPCESDLSYETFDEEESFLDTPVAGIAERRRELDRARADRELELGDEGFWMTCPKCGEYLTEHEFDSIKVERCESCGVVTIDKGEIELLLASDEDRMVAYRIKGLLQ